MIPADLLDKLREKDPELWIRYTNNDFVGKVSEAWLQHCLQEAIRARGWDMSTWIYNGGWEAMIRREMGYVNPGHMHIGASDTSASAILAAYIEAVRASR